MGLSGKGALLRSTGNPSRHEPLIRLDAQGQALLAHVGATHVMLTLSHTENYAMAVAALVRA